MVPTLLPMRKDRFQCMVVLILCWAHIAIVCGGRGLIQLCQDSSGTVHVEINGRLCLETAENDLTHSTVSTWSIAEQSICECSPCTHAPLFDAQAVLQGYSTRSCRVFPDARSVFIGDTVATAMPQVGLRWPESVILKFKCPSDTTASLDSVILII